MLGLIGLLYTLKTKPMITTNENAYNDDLTNQNLGGGSNSFGTPDNGDTTNQNFSDDADTDSSIDENSLDDTEGGGGNIPGSYSSNESMSGVNSTDDDDDLTDDDDDLLDDDTDLATGDDIADDDVVADDDDDLDTDYDDDEDDELVDDDDDVDADTTSGSARPGII